MNEARLTPIVERLEPSRFAEAAALLGRAFSEDPVTASILPRVSPERRVRKLTVMFAQLLAANARRNEPLAIVKDGAVCAVAVLHCPGSYPLPFLIQLAILGRTVLRTGPAGLVRFVRWSNRAQRHRPNRPHFYLEVLGVERDLQGRGFGSALLESIGTRLDKEAAECRLETGAERNVVLYRRFGFEVESKEAIYGTRVRFMVRRPQ